MIPLKFLQVAATHSTLECPPYFQEAAKNIRQFIKVYTNFNSFMLLTTTGRTYKFRFSGLGQPKFMETLIARH